MSQSDLLISFSKPIVCPCHGHHFLLPIWIAFGVTDACFSFIPYVESVTKNIIFPSTHLSDFLFSFCSYTCSNVPHLEWGCGFLPVSCSRQPYPCSPATPLPWPPNSRPLSLSEVLLLACSLIKNLQRPLNCLHNQVPTCRPVFQKPSLSTAFVPILFYFSQFPQMIPLLWLISPLTVIHLTFILLPCCVQAVPVPKIASFVPFDPQSCPLTKHWLYLHFNIEIIHALCRKFGQYKGL